MCSLLPVCMKLRFSSKIAVCITMISWAEGLTVWHNLLLLFEQSAWSMIRQKCIYCWFLCKMFWVLLWNPVIYKTMRYWLILINFIHYYQRAIIQKWALIFFTILKLYVFADLLAAVWLEILMTYAAKSECAEWYILCNKLLFLAKVACSPQCTAFLTLV